MSRLKVALVSVLGLFCTCSVASAQSASPAPWANKLFVKGIEEDPTKAPPPVITHDFGTVPHGTLCVHKFTITNIYDVPIQVVDVRRSCGCLEVYPPQKVLQPNETAELPISMNTAKFSGSNSQTVYVTFGPNYISTAIIRMSANSRTDVQLNPGQINFGTVTAGSKPVQTVTLEYHGRQRDWKVTEILKPEGPFEVSLKEVGRGFLTNKYQISVGLNADAPAGPISETLSLKTNDPTAPVVNVNVSGRVQSSVVLSQQSVSFDRVKVGSESVQKIVVRATSGPFRIQPIAQDDVGISVETFPAPAPVQIITVKFAPKKAGSFRKQIALSSDPPGAASATILVEAEAVDE